MASPHRSTTPQLTFDNQQPVLDAVPLSVVPYSGSLTSTDNDAASQTTELIGNLLGNKAGLVLSDAAAIGKTGPIVGSVDVGECGSCYFFSVAIPGVCKADDDFSIRIHTNGRVTIMGTTRTGEKTVNSNHQKFEMLSANLCPPGHFCISFKLPGPVNHLSFIGDLGLAGVVEGVVRKAENPVALNKFVVWPKKKKNSVALKNSVA